MQAAGRIHPDLLISFPDGEPRAERALSGSEIRISRDVLVLLAVYRDGMTADKLSAELASMGYDTTEEETSSALSALIAAGILRADPEGSGGCGQEDRLAHDQVWGTWWDAAARRFHWSSRYPPKREGGADVVPVFQRYRDAVTVALPEPGELPAIPFAAVLAGRRTTRDFAGIPLDLRQLSRLLYHTHFPHHLVQAPPYGWLPRRAWANGGARGELELYVLARNVAGLDRGMYHYQVDGHQLELTGQDLVDNSLRSLALGQEMCVTAPVTIFVTAVPWRCAAKYRTARALRVIYTDSGCLLQTFGMVATALGLGAYATAAYCDQDAETVLGIDGIRETPLLMLGAGVPGEPKMREQRMQCSPGAPFPPELFEELPPPSERLPAG